MAQPDKRYRPGTSSPLSPGAATGFHVPDGAKFALSFFFGCVASGLLTTAVIINVPNPWWLAFAVSICSVYLTIKLCVRYY